MTHVYEDIICFYKDHEIKYLNKSLKPSTLAPSISTRGWCLCVCSCARLIFFFFTMNVSKSLAHTYVVINFVISLLYTKTAENLNLLSFKK